MINLWRGEEVLIKQAKNIQVDHCDYVHVCTQDSYIHNYHT